MTKQAAITAFCRECAGEAYKDRALCTGVGKCPLWPFRLGVGVKTNAYKRAMEAVRVKYTKDVADLEKEYHLDPALFFGYGPMKRGTVVPGCVKRRGVASSHGETKP